FSRHPHLHPGQLRPVLPHLRLPRIFCLPLRIIVFRWPLLPPRPLRIAEHVSPSPSSRVGGKDVASATAPHLGNAAINKKFALPPIAKPPRSGALLKLESGETSACPISLPSALRALWSAASVCRSLSASQLARQSTLGFRRRRPFR